MSEQELAAYCFKCRQKRELREPQAVYTGRGMPATRGSCPVCGAGVVWVRESIGAPAAMWRDDERCLECHHYTSFARARQLDRVQERAD